MKPAQSQTEPAFFARIVAPPGPATDALRRALLDLRARVVQDWPEPDPLPAEGDLLCLAYSPALARRIPWIPGQPPLALVVLVAPGQQPSAEVLRLAGCDAVLGHPAPPELVRATLSVARDRFLYEARLRSRIEKLDETVRSLRTVERAKAILMDERNLSEAEAYALLRDRAMERRVTVGAVAAAFLDSHELLKAT